VTKPVKNFCFKPNNCRILATSTSSDLFTSVDYLDIFKLEGDELEISELGQLLRKFGFEVILRGLILIFKSILGTL